jgi:hypothetical protein
MRTLILCAALATFAQGANPAGTWTATFKGQTFVRLELRGESPQLAGTFRISNIEFDKEGRPRPTSPLPEKASPLSGVAQRDSTVTFSWKNGNDTDRFELRLLADGRAELRLLMTEEMRKELAAQGVPAAGPIVLTRQTRLPEER